MNTFAKKLISTALAAAAFNAYADFKVDTSNGSISFGGYLKADYRYVSGEVPYRPFWIATGNTGPDASQAEFGIRESRFNVTYKKDDVTGFLEMDFYGSDGSDAVVSNYEPRIRHALIKYKNWSFGQTWSTFMPLAAIPESVDFGGPHVGLVFIRQAQVRYTHGGLELALENPKTTGASDADDSIPDMVARYTFKGDWGQVAVAGLVRRIDSEGIDETATAGNVYGKFNLGKDDFRFQYNFGESGRYVAPGLTTDVVSDPVTGDELEKTKAYEVAYRHVWNGSLRSTVYYGSAESDVQDQTRNHWGVNLFKNLTPALTVGAEFGNYEVEDQNADSNYLQLAVKYTF
ncbi:MAG: DcaP family trimeric outer membrane transporter [Exilibacterium sp.]